jgi:hypothetical protein
MRIPLIRNVVDIVLYRLDPDTTWAYDPPGSDTQGYDPILKEPIIVENNTTTEWDSSRKELTAVRIPAQVETQSQKRLEMTFSGNVPNSRFVFVLHRMHLEPLDLIDSNGDCLIKPYDRIPSLERHNFVGSTIKTFVPNLYVFEAQDASWGAGGSTRGQDLVLLYTQTIDSSPTPRRS